MELVRLPTGDLVSAIGQGTWRMGEASEHLREEIRSIQLGLDLGATLIDTAEMYGDGGSEKVVGRAINGRRQEVFLVSKVLPHRATRNGTVLACEQSLKRLKTDFIDLFLLHWRGNVPLDETLEGFCQLRKAGKIRFFGVSNFDCQDLEEFMALNQGGELSTNQVLYNLSRRGIEYDLLPKLRECQIPLMAYSPLEQGRLCKDQKLIDFGKKYGLSPSQIALAWLLSFEDLIVIPKALPSIHVRENFEALSLKLNDIQIRELDGLFPPPKLASSLEMI